MIRRATKEDLADLYELRTEAENWLFEKGVEQWVPSWRDKARNIMRQRVENDETWINIDSEGIRGTISISGPDLDFWKESDDIDSALYFYKFIVARRCKGIGYEALDWVAEQALGQGKKWLRIDIISTNNHLADYYRNQGFQHLRTETVPGRLSGMLLQKSLN